MASGKETVIGEYRARRGISEEFDKHIIQSFNDSLGDRFRHSFEEFLSCRRMDYYDVGKALGVHRATVNRWITREMRIDLLKIYTYLISLDLDLACLRIPGGEDATIGALVGTLKAIRPEVAGDDRRPLIGCDGVRCIRYASMHPMFAAPGSGGRDDAIREICEGFNRRYPSSCGFDVGKFKALISDWYPSWSVLIDAMPYRWIAGPHEA
jgi:hypothetical protein